MIFTRVVALTAVAVVVASGPLRGQEPPLATVLDRAAAYATEFQQQLSNVVAEERYVQDVTRLNLPPGRFAAVPHRELRSDVLLVRPGGGNYVAFRDVFEVDGKPVRDRQDRLTTLFLDPTASAEAQIQRINRESARYNIGTIERTINTPTLPLIFLLPQNRARFRFTRSGKSTPAIGRSVAPADAAVIEYEEEQRATLIRTSQGLDLPARGRFWIDPATGRVLMSELVTDDQLVRATIDVSYRSDQIAGLMVPAEMRERYEGRRDGAVIEGNATYGHIRQFQVHADERLGRTAQAAVAAPDPAPIVREEPASPSAVADASFAEPPPAAPPAPEPQVAPPLLAAAPDQTAPKFTAATELVLVDFVVTDKADRPVAGLAAKDFVVKEDGKERPIVEFQAFAGGGDAAAASAADRPARATPPSSGAATVLLVDDGQLTLEQAARLRPALKTLLATLGERSGRLTLVAPGSRVSVTGQLPSASQEIAAAVDRIVGQRREERSNFPVADAEALAIATGDLVVLGRVAARFVALNPELNADQGATLARERAIDVARDARMRREAVYGAATVCLDWLIGVPGARHSLVIVSAGFAHDPRDAKYDELVTRSLRANAPIHFLDARGLQGLGPYKDAEHSTALSRNVDEGPTGWSDAAAGSTALADDTGGIVVSSTNEMAKGLTRLLDTMTTYYVIAYQPLARDKPGFRTITVDVRTRSLRVRARRGYYAGSPAAR